MVQTCTIKKTQKQNIEVNYHIVNYTHLLI